MRILYIEDDPLAVRLVSKMLQNLNSARLLSAADIRAGIRLAVFNKPDLILLDNNLPVISGLEALTVLKDPRGATSNIPVIIVSATHLSQQVFLDAGASGFISKPVQRALLLNNITRVLGHNSAQA